MKNSHARIYDILFVLVLIAAAWFRLVGLNWDQNQHLHPDERFMTMVVSAMSPVKSMPDYFNTDTSTLNPHNIGFGFYVYGDLPIIMVRYVADWMNSASAWAAHQAEISQTYELARFYKLLSQTSNWAGYDEVALLGRFFSALADLGTIFLLYLIATRIYGRKVALLAAAFSAVAVMQIQQSHFFTTDNFANFFMILTAYFAVEIGFGKAGIENWAAFSEEDEPETEKLTAEAASPDGEEPENNGKHAAWDFIYSVLHSALFWNVVGFGIALGMSAASKINAAPIAILLPIALITRYYRQRAESNQNVEAEQASVVESKSAVTRSSKPALLSFQFALVLLVMGAFLSVVSFRIFQPYAFSGPGFFNIMPNQKWVDNIKEQQTQAGGDVDFPPALQWARRSKLYSLDNMVEWGMGWPLGILACLGFLYMGWRALKGEWKQHILLWSWTGLYFVWQSMQGNPNMRYQLPVYPLLAMMAAWLALQAFSHRPQTADDGPQTVDDNNGIESPNHRPPRSPRRGSTVHRLSLAMPVIGIIVLILTSLYAYSFVNIYRVDHSRVQATHWIYQNVPGPYNLKIAQPDGTLYNQPMPYQSNVITPATPYDVQFTALASGTLQGIMLGHALDPDGAGAQTVTISFSTESGAPTEKVLARATLTADLAPKVDPRGESYTLKFDQPVTLEKDKNYFLRFETTGALNMVGSAPINETSWDDGLPLRMDGYDGYGGIYQGDHNFEMYWDDNADKLQRFTSNLDTGDYVFISSNRQWATTTRVPERYPLTLVFYRSLIGCPPEKDVIWCYNTAKPGDFKGLLGYDLIQVFESFPTLGSWRSNDQFADESFTVYDHPKVLLFQKRADYDPAKVHAILGAVDLSKVVHLTPYKASSYRYIDLMLPAAQLKTQRAGGTWSELFSYTSLQNQYPLLGLLIWYLAIGILGLFTYPFLRLILPGLSDRGYPLAKLSGLLLLAYFSWLVGSLGGTYSRLTIAIGFGLIVVGGCIAGWLKREELIEEIRSKGKYFLSVEGIFLAFFLIDLLIRVGNPDLWHAWKGGERPMDFAYLNAVLKSTSFPPYDPWFAGGYINYYYWGYVLVGTPIKLLGIVPSIAYNFVLPTLFAMLGIGGFSVAWNLLTGVRLRFDSPQEADAADDAETDEKPAAPAGDIGVQKNSFQSLSTDFADDADGKEKDLKNLRKSASSVEKTFLENYTTFNLQWLSGIAAGAGLVLIGNLGTVRMIYQGLQKLAVGNEVFQNPDAWIFERWLWAAQGIGKLFAGEMMPFYPGDWYWIPSRVISSVGGNEITEFPLFTFLYSDLHAHMIALPLTVLAIAWALSLLMARNMSRWTWLGTLVFGGVVIGALRPTNTWDFPTYLVLATLITGYAIFQYVDVGDTPRFGANPTVQRIFLALAGMGLLVGFSLLFYQPFANWYALGYSSFHQWDESKTSIWSYLTHWGLFLFVIISWMVWETRQWLAQTPLSALENLKPYVWLIELAIALMIVIIVALAFILNAPLAWFIMPLAFWALAIILRPGLPDGKRFVLFMIGTGLVITMFVEVIVLDGDIGRQNTIFKFYMQAWVMFAISSAAAVGWLVSEMREWSNAWRGFWYTAGGILLAGALLFTFTASFDKIKDRMTPNIPLTLDSMDYMKYGTFSDNGQNLDLSHDYRAIRWMQDNVKGSPVVLEAAPAGIQYAWYSRFSIYTGLPTVVGWQWHQEQQRTVLPDGTVAARGIEAQEIYRTNNLELVKSFLEKYGVRYIVVGQLERLHFPEGLAKFEEQNGTLWKEVYGDGDTVIYEVLP